MRGVLVYAVADEHVRIGIQHRVQRSLDTNFTRAKQEFEKIVQDEQTQPITYNHYYTDNIQKAREDTMKEKLQSSMDAMKDDWGGKFHVSNTSTDLQRVSTSLKNQIIVDMTQQACVESLAALNAYYKVNPRL